MPDRTWVSKLFLKMNLAEKCVFFSFEIFLSFGQKSLLHKSFFGNLENPFFGIFGWILCNRNLWKQNLWKTFWILLGKLWPRFFPLWIIFESNLWNSTLHLHQMLRWFCEFLAKISLILRKFYRIIMSKQSRSMPRNPV